MTITVEDMYGDPGMDEAALEAALNRSLNPRPATMLYDKFSALGVDTTHYVLDLGSRDARHSCELARRFGCRVLGVEPVAHNRTLAAQVIAEQEMTALVTSIDGRIEAIPAADGAFDFIWCRDVLTHIPDLRLGLRECARVLKPGGAMLVYLTLATDLMEPNEAARLYPALAVVPANMEPATLEAAANASGFTIAERDVVGSEWREWWEEHEERTTSKQLLYIARLRRDRERLLQELGRVNYEVELANSHWGVYQMLGKLCPTIYVLRKKN